MEKERWSLLMGGNIREVGGMGGWRELACFNGRMGGSIKGSIRKI